MSKKISINLTDEQYKELIKRSKFESVTITDNILSQLPINQEKKIQLADVLTGVNELPTGEFNIPALYIEQE